VGKMPDEGPGMILAVTLVALGGRLL